MLVTWKVAEPTGGVGAEPTSRGLGPTGGGVELLLGSYIHKDYTPVVKE